MQEFRGRFPGTCGQGNGPSVGFKLAVTDELPQADVAAQVTDNPRMSLPEPSPAAIW